MAREIKMLQDKESELLRKMKHPTWENKEKNDILVLVCWPMCEQTQENYAQKQTKNTKYTHRKRIPDITPGSFFIRFRIYLCPGGGTGRDPHLVR